MYTKGITKRLISILLLVVMILPSFNFNISAQTTYKNGDIVELGYYPQTQVTDSGLISNLDSCNGEWISFDYYYSGVKSDAMVYKDVSYGGLKYRAIKFSQYRGYQSTNGYKTNTVYWFRYDPIRWRIINVNTGLAVSELVLDCHQYNHTSKTTNGYKGNNYHNSDVRSFLINNFLSTSFNILQQEYLMTTNNDKVSLLSKAEADTLSQSNRMSYTSDYANSQGCCLYSDGSAHDWWTRTPANSYYDVYYMQYKWGSWITYYNWYDDTIHIQSMGVRPAITIDLNKMEETGFKNELDVDFSRLESTTENTQITIYENHADSSFVNNKYKLSSGAEVTYNGKTYTADEDGIVTIPTPQFGSVTVKKDGYITRTLTAQQLKAESKIYLQKSNGDAPVISAVWIENTDVLNNSYPIGRLEKESVTLKAEVDWGNSSAKSIVLYQSGRTVNFSGNTLTTVISDNFDATKDIYIAAADTDGRITKKVLKFDTRNVSGVSEYLDGAGVAFGDSINLTLPSHVKPSFLAGMKLGTGIYSAIPITMSAKDGKVYVAIGADLAGYENGKEWEGNTNTGTKRSTSYEKVKNFSDLIKDTFESKDVIKATHKLNNIKNTYKNAIKYPKGKVGFDADITVLGFAEGCIDANGEITWTHGGIIFNPSVSASANLPFSIGPVPLYFESSLSADLKAQLNIIFNKTARNFVPTGVISGDIKLSAGLGLGMKGVLYGGGGATGTLTPEWTLRYGDDESFKLTGSINAYVKAGIGWLELKKDFEPFVNGVLIDYPGPALAQSSLAATDAYAGIYDTENYSTKDLSYLDKNSSFAANSRNNDRLFALANTSNSSITTQELKTNIYRESTPEYIYFEDGTQLAVWIDSSDSDINGICLYYSYYDGTSWSEPMPVYDDGTLDNYPELKIINGEAYLTWQNATKKFDVNDTLDDIAAYFDVSIAKFDPETGFTVDMIAYEGLDVTPTVCGNNGKVYVVWVNNGENAWFGENDKNNIVYCEYTDNVLGVPVEKYSGLNSVDSVTASYTDRLNIAYVMDVDGDLSTIEDLFVYENGTRVTDSELYEIASVYHNGELYWISDGNLITKETSGICATNIQSRYQIIENENQKAVVYTVSDGLYSTLCISRYDAKNDTWSEGDALTDGTGFIGAFSAAIGEDDIVRVLINSSEITGDYTSEDPYGEATLSLVTVAPETDLTIGDLVYSADQFVEGSEMEIAFDVTNNGTSVVHNTELIVTDETGDVISSVIFDDDIAPGETVSTSVYYKVSNAANGQNIAVRALPVGMDDINISDNRKKVTLSYEDLSVEDMYWGENAVGAEILYASVVNRGYNTRENITVSLRRDTENGKALETITVNSIDPMSLETVSFDVSEYSADIFYITVDKSGDNYKVNDYSYISSGLLVSDAVIEYNNYTVRMPSASDLNHIRFAKGEYTTSTEIRNAPDCVNVSASVIEENTVNDVFSYEMTDGGVYSFWIRMNDGSTQIKTVDMSVMEQEVVTNGVNITVKNLYGVKDFFIAEGDFDTYGELKENGYIFSASSSKIGTKHDYTYTVSNPGIHTVVVRYNDTTRPHSVFKVDLTVDEPVFTTNGLQVMVSNIPDVRVIRTAYGEYNTPGEVKRAEGARNFSGKSAIKGKDPYTIQYREEGIVTVTVEYNNGYVAVFHYEVTKKVPTMERKDNMVTFGDLDGLVTLRYAKGEYTTSSEIKKAVGSKALKSADIVDGEITVTLEKGIYTFCVQFDDESYNYYKITVE